MTTIAGRDIHITISVNGVIGIGIGQWCAMKAMATVLCSSVTIQSSCP